MQTPVLITAGATRNPLDDMRFISAHASGKTGVRLAEKLHQSGAFEVDLLCSPIAETKKSGDYHSVVFSSTRDLMAKMKAWTKKHTFGIIIHSAAVGDFEIATNTGGKIPSGRSLTLHLVPTPKILDKLKEWNPRLVVVSFKAAPPKTTLDALEKIAKEQQRRSNSDLVFANVLLNIDRDILLVSTDKTEHYLTRDEALERLVAYLLSPRAI